MFLLTLLYWIDCILLSSDLVNFFSKYTVFLVSKSLLLFYYSFITFYEFFMIFSMNLYINFIFFLGGLFYFQFE